MMSSLWGRCMLPFMAPPSVTAFPLVSVYRSYKELPFLAYHLAFNTCLSDAFQPYTSQKRGFHVSCLEPVPTD